VSIARLVHGQAFVGALKLFPVVGKRLDRFHAHPKHGGQRKPPDVLRVGGKTPRIAMAIRSISSLVMLPEMSSAKTMATGRGEPSNSFERLKR